MRFIVMKRGERPPHMAQNTCYLRADNWNDFSFVTSFDVSLHDELGRYYEIGGVRIGFLGQTEQVPTAAKLSHRVPYEKLPSQFFSLGINPKYYSQLGNLSEKLRKEFLEGLRDVVFNRDSIKSLENERVFNISLLRDASISVIEGKYKRLIDGQEGEVPFHFGYSPTNGEFGNHQLQFKVSKKPAPSLSTNVHALIGRNGTGKTTLLDKIAKATLYPEGGYGTMVDLDSSSNDRISENYFSSVISLSFSSFDSVVPPKENSNPAQGTCFFYIGLKKSGNEEDLKTLEERRAEMLSSIIDCFHQPHNAITGENRKLSRFMHAVSILSSDQTIKSFELENLYSKYQTLRNKYYKENTSLVKSFLDEGNFRNICEAELSPLLPDMSSGHAIVLLTTFTLISKVDEKSLVLIDEPESHLHPPLLSAFIRTLSWLLNDANGVSIVATHSPVVLQEVPKKCVWTIVRNETEFDIFRPELETFGENVGVLTREVFKLDVDKSGFITVIEEAINSGMSFEQIYEDVFDRSIGSEGLIVLRSKLGAKGSHND